MTSFQGVGITVYRGVLISGGWNRGVEEDGIEECHSIQRCLHFFFWGGGEIVEDFNNIYIEGGFLLIATSLATTLSHILN